jgi:hypothetical protein
VRVLCHPLSLVGDGAPTLWLTEEAIFKAMTRQCFDHYIITYHEGCEEDRDVYFGKGH